LRIDWNSGFTRSGASPSFSANIVVSLSADPGCERWHPTTSA